jgi:hypothetical protein
MKPRARTSPNQNRGVVYDVMNWGDQRETLFGGGQPRVSGVVLQ